MQDERPDMDKGYGEYEIEVVAAPLDQRLKPDTELHSKLAAELNRMIRASERHIEQRYDDWDKVDEHMRLYLDLERAARQGDKTDSPDRKNMPYKDSIAVPVTYSTIITRVAVLFSQLTSRYPRLHLGGRESSDFEGTRIHEALLQWHCDQTEFDLQVWQGIFDSERYGIAIWYDTWEEAFGKPVKPGVSPFELLLRGEQVATQQWERIKEWNNIATIDPRDFRPDPTVPISQIKSMSYVGHKDYANWLWYKERQFKDQSGPFFNIEYARRLVKPGFVERNVDGRWESGQYLDNDTFYPSLPVVHLQWKLCPREWGLGDSDRPEIWFFSVVDAGKSGCLIIRAHPSVYGHSEFTYAVSIPDYDMHAPFVPGMGQQLIGLQDTANWLVNSHLVNARKIINDQVIYNDDLIDSIDMSSPGPAKHIRLTRRGKRLHEMGTMRIQDMYGQFNVVDITRSHLETMQFLFPQAQRMGATPDSVQGMPLPSKRTLGEVEQVQNSATLRLGQDAAMLDKQLIAPVARRMVDNCQQFMSMPVVVRLAGRLLHQMERATGKKVESIEISPADLAGRYDYIVFTPTMAPDPARMTAIWGQLLQLLGAAPQLLNPDPMTGEAIDPIAIFDEFVRSAGVNYLDRFKKAMPPMPGQAPPGMMPPEQPAAGGMAQTMSPEQIDKSVQAGNMIPL